MLTPRGALAMATTSSCKCVNWGTRGWRKPTNNRKGVSTAILRRESHAAVSHPLQLLLNKNGIIVAVGFKLTRHRCTIQPKGDMHT